MPVKIDAPGVYDVRCISCGETEPAALRRLDVHTSTGQHVIGAALCAKCLRRAWATLEA